MSVRMKSLAFMSVRLMVPAVAVDIVLGSVAWINWTTLAFFLSGVMNLLVFCCWNLIASLREPRESIPRRGTYLAACRAEPLARRPGGNYVVEEGLLRYLPEYEAGLAVPPGWERITWRHRHGSRVLSGGDSTSCPACANKIVVDAGKSRNVTDE